MMSRVADGLLVGAVIATTAACAPRSSKLDIAWQGLSEAPEAVRVLGGRSWPMARRAGKATTMPAPSDSSFVAFLDVNSNERLDLFAEPSSHCKSAHGETRCVLAQRRTSIHRVRNYVVALDGDAVTRPAADDFVVTGEYYDAGGHPDSTASLCLRADPSVCGVANADPFVHEGGGALAITPCLLREATHGSAVEVVATSQHIELPVSLPVPPALNTRFTARAANGTIYVSADTALPMTQALVWLGIPDEQRVAWSSEDTNTGTITAMHLEIPVTPEALAACPHCKIVVQVAMLADHDAIGVYSEDRATIPLEPRGMP